MTRRNRIQPRAAEQRLFVDINDAIANHQADQFGQAVDRLKDLVTASADQIAASNIRFLPPSSRVLTRWYPLDAIEARLLSLWHAAYGENETGFPGAMWSLQYWLVMTGIERWSGELLEVGLQSGLASYRAARQEDRTRWRVAWREWSNLDSAAWWRLRDAGIDMPDAAALPFAERLVEHLQEYGNSMLLNDDWESFTGMLSAFHDTFERLSEPYTRLRYDHRAKPPGGVNIHQIAVLALLALAGRAMLLEASEEVKDAKVYVQELDKFVNGFARIDRFVHQIFECERGLQRQWDWWEFPTEDAFGGSVRWVIPERYAMLALLYWLHKDQSDEPLPSFKGYAQRFIEVWNDHSDIIMKTAEIDANDQPMESRRVLARLETAVAAEQQELHDHTLAAEIDQQRVTDLITSLREQRAADRLLEHRFGEARRVRWVAEASWSDGRLAHGWLLPRDVFTAGTTIEPMRLTGAAMVFERGLFIQLAEELKEARVVSQLTSLGVADVLHAIDVGLHELEGARPLIVLHGEWPPNAIADLWRQASSGDSSLSWVDTSFRQVRMAYKRHWLVQSRSGKEPSILMLDLDQWGWLVRAHIHGEEFSVQFSEIDREKAEEMVNKAPDETRSLEEYIQEHMLKVRLEVQERVKFDVANPNAALRIPVRVDADP